MATPGISKRSWSCSSHHLQKNGWTEKKAMVSASKNARMQESSGKEKWSGNHRSLLSWELHCMAEALREAESKEIAQAWQIAKLKLVTGFRDHEARDVGQKLECTLVEVGDLRQKVHASAMQLEQEQKYRVAVERQASEATAQLSQKVEEAEKRVELLHGLLQEALEKLKSAELEKGELECRADSLQQLVDAAEKKHTKMVKEAEPQANRLQCLVDEEQKRLCSETQNLAAANDAVSSKEAQGIDFLIRERNFVWDQMKRMEETYAGKLKKKKDELRIAREEIDRFRQAVVSLKKEITVLRKELEEPQDGVHQLKKRITGLDPADNVLPIEASAGLAPDCRSGRPLGTSNASVPGQIDGNHSHEQHDEYSKTESESDELKKRMEELRHENENLRLLYGELEAAYQEKQKQERAPQVPHKDNINRNLNAELEAVALEKLANKPVPIETRGTRRHVRSNKQNSPSVRQPLKDAEASLNIPRDTSTARMTRLKKRLQSGDDAGCSSSKKPRPVISHDNLQELPSVSPPMTTAECMDECEGFHAETGQKTSTHKHASSIQSNSSAVSGTKKRRKKGDTSKQERRKPPAHPNSGFRSSVKTRKGSATEQHHTPVLEPGSTGLPALLSKSVEPSELCRPPKTRFFSSAFSIPKVASNKCDGTS